MVSPNVNKIFQEVQALNEAERQELRSLLENRAARQSKLTTQQEFDQLLRQRGVVRTVPPKPTPEVIARFKAWKPITMPGGSLSDELIRDRR
jgi:hypothetical protein